MIYRKAFCFYSVETCLYTPRLVLPGIMCVRRYSASLSPDIFLVRSSCPTFGVRFTDFFRRHSSGSRVLPITLQFCLRTRRTLQFFARGGGALSANISRRRALNVIDNVPVIRCAFCCL